MSTKISLIIIAVAVVVGGGAFYGGMKYGQSKAPRGRISQADFQNLSPEERQQRFGQLGLAGMGSRGGRFGGAGSASGEIISKDDRSITVKLRDGGSKIVFFSDSTEIVKSVNGIFDDLTVGKTVFFNGTANQDGSITAQSIQIRPAATNQ